jgi:hypothetical protein
VRVTPDTSFGSQLTTRSSRRRHPAQPRQGIILLIVLVLLALFTMMLITFVVATVNTRQGALQAARAEQTGDPPQSIMHSALMQLVRGARNPNSVIGPHSLLEDMYGSSVPGRITASNTNPSVSPPPATGYFYTQLDASSNPQVVPYLPTGNSALPPGNSNSPQAIGTYPTYSYNHTPIIGFRVSSTSPSVGTVAGGDFPDGFNRPYGFYTGRVITMLDGPAAGRSSRVVGHWYDNTNGLPYYSYFQVLGFDGLLPYDPGVPFTFNGTSNVYPSYRFVINGRAFSGTGFGMRPLAFQAMAYNSTGALVQNQSVSRLLDAFDPSTPVPSAYDITNYDPTNSTDTIVQKLKIVGSNSTVFPYALLPNPRRGVFSPFIPNPANNNALSMGYLDPAGPGGANEDYDAPDFQNMLLAMRIWADANHTGNYQLATPLPSLHRPDLISYWNTRWQSQLSATSNYLIRPITGGTAPYDATTGGGAQTANYFAARNLLRKIVLRPLSFQDDTATAGIDESEHPNFTGSNPNFNLLSGPWDVDNDGDGTPDSIWADMGFPVQTAPDGRRYKPLVAALVIDMDGKLNLNAHSNWWHSPSTSASVQSRFLPIGAPVAQTTTSLNSPTKITLKAGSGYGPAEISLHPLFEPGYHISNTTFSPTLQMSRLLGGDAVNLIDGRYGEIEVASGTNQAPLGVAPGPGISLVDDPIEWLRETDYPQIHFMGTVNNYPHSGYPYLPTGSSTGTFTLDSLSGVWSPSSANPQIWMKRSAFGTPNDLDGDGILALDPRGQPLYIDWGMFGDVGAIPGSRGFGEKDDTVDDPYEMDLSLNTSEGSYSGNPAFPYFSANVMTSISTSNVVSLDAPFTPAELERILRRNDIDAGMLPDRLIRLAPLGFTDPNPLGSLSSQPLPLQVTGRFPYLPELAQMPNLVTTHSFDVPAPAMVFTSPDLLTTAGTVVSYDKANGIPNPPTSPALFSHISQVLTTRIYYENNLISGAQPTHANLDLAITQLISPDLIGGEKMNINRTLGDGQDDNVAGWNNITGANNFVDEPGETEGGWAALDVIGGVPTPIPFDLDNDGIANNFMPNNPVGHDDLKARQLLARHLYILLMLFKDPGFVIVADLNGDMQPPTTAIIQNGPRTVYAQDIDTAYYFAQWAINVVDFRDRDAIMTPFEFDVDPFFDNDGIAANTTWDVDGVLNAALPAIGTTSADDVQVYRGLVWGAERPELLITETLAAHDRRTRDTNVDGAGFVGPMKDVDFDQVRRPQGSLVIELFNPNPPLAVGNKLAGQAPNELYASAGTDALGAPMFGVNLALQTPGAQGYPVWRLATLSRAAALSLPPNNTNAGAKPLPMRQPVLPYPATLPQYPLVSATASYPPSTLPYPNQIATTTFQHNESVIDRVAYFTQQPATIAQIPQMDVEAYRQFYAMPSVAPGGTTPPIIPPNRYAIVGPGCYEADPYPPSGAPASGAILLGLRSFANDPGNATGTAFPSTIKNTYQKRIVLDPTASPQVAVHLDMTSNYYGAYAFPGETKPAIAIPMAPLAFTGVTPAQLTPSSAYANAATTRLLRFSVSEPSIGYPVPSGPQLGGTVPAWDENGYYTSTQVQSLPYDSNPNNFLPTNDPNDFLRQQAIITPTTADSTQYNYTIVYLQRLANPLLPWDPVANPYMIVDQMWVDLTAYNSEKHTNTPQQQVMNSSTTFNEPLPGGAVSATSFVFDTRQRAPVPTGIPNPATSSNTPTGPIATSQSLLSSNNLWYPFGSPPTTGAPYGPTAPTLPLGNATIGYLNFEYGDYGNTGPRMRPGQFQVYGSLFNAQEYYGDPTIPFPWLNWNDRPYVSSKELMLVPLGSPTSLLTEMTVDGPIMTGQLNTTTAGPIEPTNPTPLADSLPKGEFGHLPNFFHSPRYLVNGTRTDPLGNPTYPNTQPVAAANFYRLLEFVHVPSRYAGTETWFPPLVMEGSDPRYAPPNGLPAHQFHPPFNRVSRFRDPGRVNINTIFDPFVWQGIIDDGYSANTSSPPWRNLWKLICTSRQGTTIRANDGNNAYLRFALANSLGPNASNLTTTAVSPSLISAPFRSYAGHTLVPLDSMRTGNDTTRQTSGDREIDGTMLRGTMLPGDPSPSTQPDPTGALTDGFPTQNAQNYPLFEYPGFPGQTGILQWWELSGTSPSVNPTQNPYFAYKAFTRLDNLLTTRSNVYAIWLTVGYFEVTPAPSNDPQRSVKYPDGWVLGQELNSDMGDIQRHRSFYMYDRTIPVGFERGENHNAHRGILLERFIE